MAGDELLLLRLPPQTTDIWYQTTLFTLASCYVGDRIFSLHPSQTVCQRLVIAIWHLIVINVRFKPFKFGNACQPGQQPVNECGTIVQ